MRGFGKRVSSLQTGRVLTRHTSSLVKLWITARSDGEGTIQGRLGRPPKMISLLLPVVPSFTII